MSNEGSQGGGGYEEVFNLEIEAICYALTNYPGEIYDTLFYMCVRDLKNSFRAAIESNVTFDVIDIASRLSRAAKYLVDERDISFEILNLLPQPRTLSEDAQFVMAQIIDQVEQTYGGALEHVEKKWATERRQAA